MWAYLQGSHKDRHQRGLKRHHGWKDADFSRERSIRRTGSDSRNERLWNGCLWRKAVVREAHDLKVTGSISPHPVKKVFENRPFSRAFCRLNFGAKFRSWKRQKESCSVRSKGGRARRHDLASELDCHPREEAIYEMRRLRVRRRSGNELECARYIRRQHRAVRSFRRAGSLSS